MDRPNARQTPARAGSPTGMASSGRAAAPANASTGARVRAAVDAAVAEPSGASPQAAVPTRPGTAGAGATHPARSTSVPRPKHRGTKWAKATTASDCVHLEQLPNIGPSMAADLRSLGIDRPQQLAGWDGLALYQALCRRSGQRQDACVLDTFLAATDFMRGAPASPWWRYTAARKALHGVLPKTGLDAT